VRFFNASGGTRLPGVVHALLRQMVVVDRVQTAVRGLLADEAFSRFTQCGVFGRVRQGLNASLHGVNEELFADRKLIDKALQ